jgi:hypothetical protein
MIETMNKEESSKNIMHRLAPPYLPHPPNHIPIDHSWEQLDMMVVSNPSPGVIAGGMVSLMIHPKELFQFFDANDLLC